MKQMSYDTVAMSAVAMVSWLSAVPALAQSVGTVPAPKTVQVAPGAVVPGVAAPVQSTQPTAKPAPAAVSVFTTLELKACKRISSDQDGGRWQCGGPKGYEILFAEGDLRQFLGFGAKAREQRAAKQTLGPFNSIFKDTTDRATVQWRGVTTGGKFVPFASHRALPYRYRRRRLRSAATQSGSGRHETRPGGRHAKPATSP